MYSLTNLGKFKRKSKNKRASVYHSIMSLKLIVGGLGITGNMKREREKGHGDDKTFSRFIRWG